MESSDQGPRRGIPRLSRLPVPRAALVKSSVPGSQDEVFQQIPQIPRINGTRISKVRKVTLDNDTAKIYPQPSTESANEESRQDGPPIDQSASAQPAASLDGVDRSEITIPATPKDKRKPRPSLSERTVETLSQLTPSPSPSRRQMSNINGYSTMAPPFKPASALRSFQSNRDLRARQSSPSKESQRSPSRNASPGPRPIRPQSSQDHRIPGTSKIGRDSTKIAVSKPHQFDNNAKITSIPVSGGSAGNSNTVPPPLRMKVSQDLRIPASKSSTIRTSSVLSTTTPTKSKVNSAPGNHHSNAEQRMIVGESSYKRSGFDTRSKPESLLPRRPTIIASSREPVITNPAGLIATNTQNGKFPKSSLTLRDTIARAKAAKRATSDRSANSEAPRGHNVAMKQQPETVFDLSFVANSSKTLQNRIDTAVTSGVLNIAALGLKALPEEIGKLYNFDENSKIKWSEAVDLIKFNAADNELEDLPDTFFPDWSEEELREDDEKSNQFGSLQVLDFHDNRLHSVPEGFRRLEHLQTLFLSNNQLKLDAIRVICQLPHLRELYLANNKLEGGLPQSLARMTKLEVLDLHSNHISMLPDSLSSMKNLKKLDLSNNSLKSITTACIDDLPLTNLNLAKNMISGTLFTKHYKNHMLQTMNLASNKITSLCDDEVDLPRLHTLICDNNQLVSLPSLAQYRSLATLSAAENNIVNLPPGFTDGDHLHSVNLSGNQLQDVSPFIAQMNNLTLLNITANPLRQRKYLALTTDQLKTELAAGLDTEKAHGGGMVTTGGDEASIATPIQNGTISVETQPVNGVLDLSSKRLRSTDLNAIQLDQTVHTLSLVDNSLNEFWREILCHPMVGPTLKHLDISRNQSLHSVDYLSGRISLPVLESLRLSGTGMQSLAALTTYLHAPSLGELDISNQRILGPLPQLTRAFPRLKTLIATDNRFCSVTVEALRGLEVVDIRNNDIEQLPAKIGELGNIEATAAIPGRLRTFHCSGNKFRVPRPAVLERGTEAILRDLRRMVPADEIGDEWRGDDPMVHA